MENGKSKLSSRSRNRIYHRGRYCCWGARCDVCAQKIIILERENNVLKAKNSKLKQEILELRAKLAANRNVSAEQDQSNKESDVDLSYVELQKMNTVKEVGGDQNLESDASSVDEMTGQGPAITLAELLSMNPVGD